MIEWKPNRLLGTTTLLVAILAIVLLDLFLFTYVQAQHFSLGTFVLAVLLGVTAPILAYLAYMLYQLRTLNYLLDRDSITIRCGGIRHVIPIHATQVVSGGEDETPVPGRRFPWPGYWVGDFPGGTVLYYATEPPSRHILIRSRNRAYAITPENPGGFLRSVESRQTLGPSQRAVESTARAEWMDWPFWRDRSAQGLILAGLLANVALFGALAAAFASVPQLVPIHYDASGMVDRIAPRIELLRVPAIGAITWSVNTFLGLALHRWESLATYLLAAVAVLVQALLAIALYRIVT
ncbi:MAG: PH domain-containing protein [Anaerolineae bacterium]